MPDSTLTILTALVELVGILLGLFYFLRRFSLERVQTIADAHSDEASALLTYQQAEAQRFQNYDEMFTKLLSRDKQIADLNSKIAVLQTEVAQIGILREQLEMERARNNRLETELREERERSNKLQRRVDELESYIDKLKQSPKE